MHAGCLRDVIKRDLSFQTRRQSSRNSSGVLRKYADHRWLAFSKNGPDSPCTVFQITVRYGSTWRGCRRRGTQKLKIDVRWLRVVLRCCSDVVELDLSFQTRIRLSSNSSGQPSCGPDTVLEKKCAVFRSIFIIFWTARATIGARYAHGEVKNMRFYNSDFHLIFDSDEISDFRVPRLYIWLNCAFL